MKKATDKLSCINTPQCPFAFSDGMCRKNPHFWWIIILMGLLIIGLVAHILSARVTDSSVIMKSVSDASTLLSITLSIFAIMYTYTSNNEMHRQFEKINSAADRISHLVDGMIKLEATIQSKLDEINASQRDIAADIKLVKNSGIVPVSLSNIHRQSEGL